MRTRVGRRLQQAPLAVTVVAKALVYGSVIVAVEVGGLGQWLVLGPGSEKVVQSPFLPLSVVFSFVFTFAFIFVLEVAHHVGGRTLRHLVLGRYHRPRVEERFFLFVDVVGSTALAERLGPLAVHRFLNRVFSRAAEPVVDHGGEIYQYVGDELVVTWTIARGRVAARPVACFFAIEAAIAAAAPRFAREFGVVPRLRGALHAGPVVTGEVGESKRDIVFHGDVMNAAARLEQATRDLGVHFIVSADALRLVLDPDGYRFDDLGLHALRGRSSPVRVFSASRKE